MKRSISRRKIVKSFGVIGAGSLLAPGIVSLAQAAGSTAQERVLENGRLRVRLRPDSLTLTV